MSSRADKIYSRHLRRSNKHFFFIIDIGYNLSTTHELENEKQQIKHFLEPNIDVVKSNANSLIIYKFITSFCMVVGDS